MARKKAFEEQIGKTDKQIQILLSRIVNASSEALVGAYEKRISELEYEKISWREKLEGCAVQRGTFEELFELAMQFLASPSKIWNLGAMEYKKLVLRLTFSGHLSYSPFEGFRTPQTSLPFKLLAGVSGPEKLVVRPSGIEPLSPP